MRKKRRRRRRLRYRLTLAREDRRRRSQSRLTRRRLFYGVGGGVIALALITGLVLPSVGHLGFGGSTAANPVQTVPDAGTEIPVQEGTVITVGAEHAAYSTSPPTSGPRYAEAVEWGVYDEQIADETVVRNLEQGAVVFNYSLSDEEAVANLQEFVEALPGYPGCYVMQPHAAVTDGSVTVTSWGWTESYTGIDRFGMQQFVASHRNDAPRFVGATCGADTTIEASTSVSHDGT